MLDTLVAGARDDALRRESLVPFDELSLKAQSASPPSGDVLRPRAETVGLIAEVKRASPSKGRLAEIPDPVWLAEQYQLGGASAISVLTETRQFLGSLEDLRAVSASVGIPALRKDFLTSRYQIVEARANGASMVLLIAAVLTDAEIRDLLEETRRWGMVALVEAHNAKEVRRAVDLGAEIVGVNARDLGTFEVDINLFGQLRSLIPAGIVAVAESAVRSAVDVARYRAEGADYVLVGEALVRGENPQQRVREFLLS